jgi:hypothetical protein
VFNYLTSSVKTNLPLLLEPVRRVSVIEPALLPCRLEERPVGGGVPRAPMGAPWRPREALVVVLAMEATLLGKAGFRVAQRTISSAPIHRLGATC